MKVSLALSDFPMLLVDMMVADLEKRHPGVDVQVGGEDTVFINFYTDDIVKVQELCIIADMYHFKKGMAYEDEILGRDEE